MAFIKGMTEAYAQTQQELSPDERTHVRARVRSILSAMLPDYFQAVDPDDPDVADSQRAASSGQAGQPAGPGVTRELPDDLLGAIASVVSDDSRDAPAFSPSPAIAWSEDSDDVQQSNFDPLFGLGGG